MKSLDSMLMLLLAAMLAACAPGGDQGSAASYTGAAETPAQAAPRFASKPAEPADITRADPLFQKTQHDIDQLRKEIELLNDLVYSARSTPNQRL